MAGLHAGGAAGFFAAARSVEPEIHALHQFARDFHVVVFDEDDVLPEVGIARELHDLADEGFARLIFRMRLAGDDDLHRALAIAENFLQALHIAEQQRGAFIGGEAAREADGERVRIEHFGGVAQFGGGGLAANGRGRLPLADEGNQAAFAAAMHFEKLFVRNVPDLLPDAVIVPAVAPVGFEVLIVEIGQIAVDPAGQVDAVGHRSDRRFPDRQRGPEGVPHLLRNLAVQPADGVAIGRSIQRQNRHGERLAAILADCGGRAP